MLLLGSGIFGLAGVGRKKILRKQLSWTEKYYSIMAAGAQGLIAVDFPMLYTFLRADPA